MSINKVGIGCEKKGGRWDSQLGIPADQNILQISLCLQTSLQEDWPWP